MAQFQRFHKRSSSAEPAGRVRVNRGTYRTHMRSYNARRRGKKSGGMNFKFLRNLIILGLIIGAVVFFNNGGMKTVQTFFSSYSGEVAINLPEIELPELPELPEEGSEPATEEQEPVRIEEALRRFFDPEDEQRDLEVVDRTSGTRARVEQRSPAPAPEPEPEPTRTATRTTEPARTPERTQTASRTTSTREIVRETPRETVSTPQRETRTEAQTTAIPAERESEPVERTTPRESPATPVIGYVYLVRIDEQSGQATIVNRERTFSPKPDVNEAVSALLKGATRAEASDDISTVVGKNVYLISAKQEGSTAYLNFNTAFELHPHGHRGLTLQIYQVVYTATQFASIDTVVILIDGAHKDVLGGDGAVQNRPFTRANIVQLLTL